MSSPPEPEPEVCAYCGGRMTLTLKKRAAENGAMPKAYTWTMCGRLDVRPGSGERAKETAQSKGRLLNKMDVEQWEYLGRFDWRVSASTASASKTPGSRFQ
jgi:hypothetical protein